MQARILAAALTLALVSGVAVPRSFQSALNAQDLWFDVVMGPNEPIFRPADVPHTGPDSTVYLAGLGQICILNPDGTPANPIRPYGATFRGALAFAVGSFMGENAVDLMFAATAEPSTRPLVVLSPGPPPAVLGETNVPAIATTGIRIAVADVDADNTPETLIGTGPGATSVVSVVPLQTDDVITFEPFGPGYRGGVYVAAGDLDGNGHEEIIVSQQQGSEVKAFELRGGEAHELGRMRPQGHDYSGGFRVAAGDFNADGKADIITGAISGPPIVRVIDVNHPNGRLLANVVVSDQHVTGGPVVAYGRFGNAAHVLAAHGRSVLKFKITDTENPRPRFFSDNPFAVIASVFMDLQTYTPPPANR